MQARWGKRSIRTAGLLGVGLAVGLAGCGEPSTEQQIADTMRRTEDIRELAAINTPPYRFLPAERAFDDLLDEWRQSPDAQEAVVEAESQVPGWRLATTDNYVTVRVPEDPAGNIGAGTLVNLRIDEFSGGDLTGSVRGVIPGFLPIGKEA